MKQSDKRGPRHKPHDPERLRRHVPWAQTLIEHRRTSPAPSAELGESSTIPAPAADLEEELEP